MPTCLRRSRAGGRSRRASRVNGRRPARHRRRFALEPAGPGVPGHQEGVAPTYGQRLTVLDAGSSAGALGEDEDREAAGRARPAGEPVDPLGSEERVGVRRESEYGDRPGAARSASVGGAVKRTRGRASHPRPRGSRRPRRLAKAHATRSRMERSLGSWSSTEAARHSPIACAVPAGTNRTSPLPARQRTLSASSEPRRCPGRRTQCSSGLRRSSVLPRRPTCIVGGGTHRVNERSTPRSCRRGESSVFARRRRRPDARARAAARPRRAA